MPAPDYTQTAKLLQKTGLPANVPWATQLTQDEIEWGAITPGGAGGPQDPYAQNWTKGGGFTGFKFDNSLATADVMRVLGFAEKFASTYGWKYFPPASVIQAMAHQPNLSEHSAYHQFFGQLPGDVQSSHPYMEFGMSESDYDMAVGSIQDTLSTMLGSRDVNAINPYLTRVALQENWSPQRIKDFLQRDPTVNAQAPWLKHGMTYDQFRQYTADPQNQLALLHRYGTTAPMNDQAFLANLEHPLEKIAAAGGPITPAPTGITPQKTVSARGNQSQVR
jgi:hypothetical protein